MAGRKGVQVGTSICDGGIHGQGSWGCHRSIHVPGWRAMLVMDPMVRTWVWVCGVFSLSLLVLFGFEIPIRIAKCFKEGKLTLGA